MGSGHTARRIGATERNVDVDGDGIDHNGRDSRAVESTHRTSADDAGNVDRLAL